MGCKRLLTGLFLLFFFIAHSTLNAKVYYDTENSSLNRLFIRKNTKYVVRYQHVFEDTLKIPDNSEIYFDGGCLSGPVVFCNSILSGRVKLEGSSISGSVRNRTFDASWLCSMDGKTDDAPRINEMIHVCDNVFFPKGYYRLISAFDAIGMVGDEQIPDVKAHIGINKSNISLIGEQGTIFVTDEPLGTICVFSQPNKIEKSIRNIVIKDITFNVKNDGHNFHQFMHTIKTIGVNGLSIINCVFNDFWGDAICLSHYEDTPETGERTRNQNVIIKNNIIVGGDHHNNRNGISVINGKKILIKGNTIKNTSRKDMPGAIDVEPNNSAYTVENIRIIDNYIEGCGGTAGGICIHANNKGGPAHHIRIEQNVIRNCTSGLAFVVKDHGTTDNFVVKNNFVDERTLPYQFVGEGSSKNWNFSNNTFERACRQNIPGKINVKNLVSKNNKKKD